MSCNQGCSDSVSWLYKVGIKGLIEMSPGKGRVRMHIDKLPIIPASFKIGMTSLYKD